MRFERNGDSSGARCACSKDASRRRAGVDCGRHHALEPHSVLG